MYHIVKRIETVAAIRNVVKQMQRQLAVVIMAIVKVNRAINHNDSHVRKMDAAKTLHINAQRVTTIIVMTKTNQTLTRKQLQQQVTKKIH